MSNVDLQINDPNFAKALAKGFVVDVAITASVATGLLLVGYGVAKIKELNDARKAKKSLED
jgi:hypothetical protein